MPDNYQGYKKVQLTLLLLKYPQEFKLLTHSSDFSKLLFTFFSLFQNLEFYGNLCLQVMNAKCIAMSTYFNSPPYGYKTVKGEGPAKNQHV